MVRKQPGGKVCETLYLLYFTGVSSMGLHCRTSAPTTLPTETQHRTRTITPLPAAIDLHNLPDCTLAVSLEEGDVYVDDTGAMQMCLTVYCYDLYDMVAIAQMEVGDIILIAGQPVEITQLERTKNGSVLINGGLDFGGYELCTNENTVYYQIGYSDAKSWQPVGEVTLPVTQNFVYTDQSDLDRDPVVRYPGDFLIPGGEIDYHFTPHNTTVTIEKGMVIAMTRVYTP